jgi:hypothetical protein
VEAHRVVRHWGSYIFRQSAHRWRWGCQPYMSGCPLPAGRFLVLIMLPCALFAFILKFKFKKKKKSICFNCLLIHMRNDPPVPTWQFTLPGSTKPKVLVFGERGGGGYFINWSQKWYIKLHQPGIAELCLKARINAFYISLSQHFPSHTMKCGGHISLASLLIQGHSSLTSPL